MADQVVLYISAASDLQAERDLLGRVPTELPVTLGWRIVQTPAGNVLLDEAAVARADVHLLLLGSDIRAPIGQEWLLARRAGRRITLFLKAGVLQTQAARSFIRYVGGVGEWRTFDSTTDLRRQVLKLLADHILENALYYALSGQELTRLQEWREEREAATEVAETSRGGTGESSIILSRERFMPSAGVVLTPPDDGEL